MRTLFICFSLVLVVWPFVCVQAAGISTTSIRQLDERGGDGAVGAGTLLQFLIRRRWWVSYAGVAILMLALAL